ncbi:IS110 family transposase (plasmid) [Enterococcus faecium]|nr:IS110 family transposase [Enterococcus faecium]
MSYRLGALAQESINVVVIPEYQCLTSIPGVGKVYAAGLIAEIGQIERFEDQTSIPGVGKVYAAGLIAEIGQIERFEDQTKLAKYAGLSWKVNQSGNYQSQNTPLTKQGNRYKEVPKHQHKRALVLTARKFTRLVDTLIRRFQSINTNVHSS